jgi:group II intron reverse transcriptase/maturase
LTLAGLQKPKKPKKAYLRNAEYYDCQNIFDRLYEQSQDGIYFNDLMKYITSEKNIRLAYRNIKNNHGSRTAGADGKTIANLEKWEVHKLISHVQRKLSYYQPQKVRRVEIPKENGKTRPLGIPTIMDRLIQQCVLQVLEPICEAKFFERSNGFRPNRNAEQAIAQAYKMIQLQKLHFVVDIDIKSFFDNVKHGKLLKQMWTFGIRDKKLISIISAMLKAEVAGIGFPEMGTPQGGVISPLLSNIVLNELDWWVASQFENMPTDYKYAESVAKNGTPIKSLKYETLRKYTSLKECFIVRYADDFKIFCKTKSDADKMFIAVKMWLSERLGLEISPEKSKVVNLKKTYSEFLGFKLKATPKGKRPDGTPKYVVKSKLTDKSKRKIESKLKSSITAIQKPANEKEEYKAILRHNSMIIGWHTYYRIATNVNLDFNRYAFLVHRALKNRLRDRLKKTSDIPLSAFIRVKYGASRQLRYVGKHPIVPIGYVKHKNPMFKKKSVNKYTPEGRAEIHKQLETINMELLHFLMLNPAMDKSIEFNDNRLALFCAQQGKCAITGDILTVENLHCHHKKPRKHGCDDSYQNLVLVSEVAHILIHAVNSKVIQKYMREISPNKRQMDKINSLRKQLSLEMIPTQS